MKNNKFRLSVIAAAVVGVSGCLGGGGGSDSSTTTSGGSINGSSVFPSGLRSPHPPRVLPSVPRAWLRQRTCRLPKHPQ